MTAFSFKMFFVVVVLQNLAGVTGSRVEDALPGSCSPFAPAPARASLPHVEPILFFFSALTSLPVSLPLNRHRLRDTGCIVVASSAVLVGWRMHKVLLQTVVETTGRGDRWGSGRGGMTPPAPQASGTWCLVENWKASGCIRFLPSPGTREPGGDRQLQTLVLVRVSIAVTKHHDQVQAGEERVCLACTSRS